MQFSLTPHAKKRIEQRGIPVPDSGMNMKPAGKKTRRVIRELCLKSGIQFDKIYWTYRIDTSEGRKIVVYVCTLVDVGSYLVITAFILNSVTNHQKDMAQMKLAKASYEEIDSLLAVLSDIERLSKELEYQYLNSIDFSDYQVIGKFDKGDTEQFLHDILKHIANIHFQRILFNLTTLLENCADPDSKTLEFSPKIKAAFELLEKQYNA